MILLVKKTIIYTKLVNKHLLIMDAIQKHKNKAPKDNTVVICGASCGIGRATALEFAKQGYTVVLAARRENVLSGLVEECLLAGAQDAVYVKADVTVAEDMKKVADTALATGNSIDVWINNAGTGAVGIYDEIPMDVHEQVIKINLIGYMNGTYAVLPIFKDQGYGTIINTISIGGWVPEAYTVAYTASKFGLRGFSESLRCEMRHFKDIYICDVYPAYIDTPAFDRGANYTGKKLKPIPPVFSPGRVAKAMVKLAEKPKHSTYVGETALMYKTIYYLAPALTRSAISLIMENYFSRAKPAKITNGALFIPVPQGVTESGGWLSNSKTVKAALITTMLIAGAASAIYVTKKKSS